MIYADSFSLAACQDRFGGFQSDKIIDALVEYAGVLFDRLGNDVTYWLTVNEPRANCQFCMKDGTLELYKASFFLPNSSRILMCPLYTSLTS
jgi:beta-glucosidase/6-phospho-beta-glucosidase/beta-galactosidase